MTAHDNPNSTQEKGHGGSVISVSSLVEGQGRSALHRRLLALSFLLMACDSYDVSALAFAAPSLMRHWRIGSEAMGLIFSAGLIGLLVGSIVFGRLGDKCGRKTAILLSASGFSIFTILTGLSNDALFLALMRFLAGVGLGGTVPNAIAMVAEFSPSRLRATAVAVMFAGYSLGGIVAGITALATIEAFGWRVLFYFGGVISLFVTVAFARLLPETLQYLVSRPNGQAEVRRVAAMLRPGFEVPQSTEIVADVDVETRRAGVRGLLEGRLRLATLLLWVAYVANSMTVFALASWLPSAVVSAGMSTENGAVSTALLYSGGAIGGILGGKLADRYGFISVVLMATFAVPVVAGLGISMSISPVLWLVSFLAGAFAFGAQTCLHGMAGVIYPTSCRSSGVGWALGVAKVGSILGPYLGGLILADFTGPYLFLAAAVPLIIVAVAAFTLHACGVGRLRVESAI